MTEIAPIDEMLLLRLRDCAISSRLGMPDQGFPDYMKKLQALGYVTPKGSGYIVTDAGLATVRHYRELLRRI